MLANLRLATRTRHRHLQHSLCALAQFHVHGCFGPLKMVYNFNVNAGIDSKQRDLQLPMYLSLTKIDVRLSISFFRMLFQVALVT